MKKSTKSDENKENGLVEFIEFKRFYDSLGCDLSDEDFNFLMYKMKVSAQKIGGNLIDLDTDYLNQLFGEISNSESTVCFVSM